MSGSRAAAAARDLRSQVPQWIEQTRADALRCAAQAADALTAAALRFAEGVADTSTPEELVPLDVVQRAASVYLGEAGEVLDAVALQLSAGLADRLADLTNAAARAGDAEGQAMVDAVFTWDRAVRAYTTMVQQYLCGVVQGGGLTLGIYLEVAPGECADRGRIWTVVQRRLAFLPERLESAVNVWLSEVEQGLVDLLGGLAVDAEDTEEPPQTPTPDAAATVLMPRRQPTASRPRSPETGRLAQLLALAREHGVTVRNVPDPPSARYLDTLEAQLDEVIARRNAALAAADVRRARLDELLEFAKQVRVKVKAVPNNPSAGWLHKVEAKLAEVAVRKGVPLPESFEPPTQQEAVGTPDRPPERRDGERQEAAMRARAASMVARAEEAGLELGRVPTIPTDDWIAETEAKLEVAVEHSKERSKQIRHLADQDRRDRVERLKSRAAEANIELGPVPPIPAVHWLDRVEARVARALGENTTLVDHGYIDPVLLERLEAIESRAGELGLSLGAVPPVPDSEWLVWAEARVQEAEVEHDVQPSNPDATGRHAYLVYEEGTVQEQIWLVEGDALTIGRARGNVVQVRDDNGVSRRHCTLSRADGAFTLRDEDSTKGTRVDGREIQEAVLMGGERITLGETHFTFRVR